MRRIILVLGLGLGNCFAQTGISISEYIRNYSPLAVKEQLRTGIPAAITLAQGIHESGAGQGDLAQRSNNHFGIKCKSDWTGDRVFHDDDTAGECFRAYQTVDESYRDHSDFLVNGKRYGFLFDINLEDYKGWAYGLKQAGYATNPKYPQILIRIIEENGLDQFTSLALESETGDEEFITASVTEKTPPVQVTNAVKLTTAAPGDQRTKPDIAAVNPVFIRINNCLVIEAPAGSSWESLAKQHKIPLKKLLAYNDVTYPEKLTAKQWVFLEQKKKQGVHNTHKVQKGESAWSISQKEGIQLKKLLQHNRLSAKNKLQTGQLLYLQGTAPRN